MQSPSLISTLMFTYVPHDTGKLLMTNTFISLVMTLSWVRNSTILLTLASFLIFIWISIRTFKYNVSKWLVPILPCSSASLLLPVFCFTVNCTIIRPGAHSQTWESLIFLLLLLQFIIKYCQFYLQNTASVAQSLISGSSIQLLLWSDPFEVQNSPIAFHWS